MQLVSDMVEFECRPDYPPVPCLLHYSNFTDEDLETELSHCLDDRVGGPV